MEINKIREKLKEYSRFNNNIEAYCDKLTNINFDIDSFIIDDKLIKKISDIDDLLKNSNPLECEILVASIYNSIINIYENSIKYDEKTSKIKEKISQNTDVAKEKILLSFSNSKKRIDIFLIIGIALLIILICFAVFAGIYQIKSDNESSPWYVWVMVFVGFLGSAADVAGIFFTLREIRDDKLKERVKPMDDLSDNIMNQAKDINSICNIENNKGIISIGNSCSNYNLLDRFTEEEYGKRSKNN